MEIRSEIKGQKLYGKWNCYSASPCWLLAVLEGPLRAFGNCFHKSATWIYSVSVNPKRTRGLSGDCVTIALLAQYTHEVQLRVGSGTQIK